MEILLLLPIVSLIPILGGIMEESHLIKNVIDDFQISNKPAYILTPALFGLLPIAGGALLSAPILDQIDEKQEISKGRKVAVNIWYRHIMILVYPLSSDLLIASDLTGLNLYVQILGLLVPLSIMQLIGYFMLIKPIETESKTGDRDIKHGFIALIPILIAPLTDIFFRIVLPNFKYPQFFMILGLLLSLVISFMISTVNLNQTISIIKKMKIWRFPLMILGIYWFLEIFTISPLPTQIGQLNLPFILFLLIGTVLGFTTGRITLPCTLIIPIVLSQLGLVTLPLPYFVFLYFAIFLGYLATPIHPCVSYSLDYFNIKYHEGFKYIIGPIAIGLGILFLGYLLFIIFT
jgi:uncharacterized protein